ncbi:MAG: hypothetical protein RLZZ598_741 [Pseudomonadota bacterium]|jgi:hypothetical protein
MSQALLYLVDRVREPSAWRGLVWLLAALGVALSPEQVEAILAAGAAVAGLIGVFTCDRTSAAGPWGPR